MRAPLPPVATRFVMFTPPIVYCAWLWWLSSQPVNIPLDANDKLVHVGAYGLLAVLTTRAFWFTSDWRPWKVGFVGWFSSTGYGIIDEIHQSFVPGRDASLLDILADTLGSFLGMGITLGMYLLTQVLDRRRTGPS